MTDELVQLTVASSEAEAALISGYLASRGIHSTYDKGGVFQPLFGGGGETGQTGVGRQEILVLARDLDAAKKALEELPAT